jgi:hypothetical protein
MATYSAALNTRSSPLCHLYRFSISKLSSHYYIRVATELHLYGNRI